LSGEITAELILARIRVSRSESRVAALESLLEAVWTLERELRRPVTVPDVLSSCDPSERTRLLRLVRSLRNERQDTE
jgi:hypothetical protein